jgi:hypothetical protein
MALPNRKILLYMQTVLYAALGSAPLLAADGAPDAIRIKPGPPVGFEQLAGPQETEVDGSFGGLKIGSFRAVYTPSTIAFATPEDIVNKIPSLKHDAVARVTQALTGELPTEAAHICGRPAKEGCGILKPEVAGVIFSEGGFHADVFVNPTLLDTQDSHTDKILPPASNVFSAVHQFNGNVTGSPGAGQDFSLLDNSTIAYGPARLNMVGILSNQQNQLNTLTASLDKWGLDNEAGFFNSRQLQLLPQVSMAGVSVGTSLNTNLALRTAAGSTLSIFLPQRSYVSLVYNNIIYSTDLYDAGNQVINTSALPQGAYEVTIRVRDLGGGQTEEKRFFAKNFAIPPKDQPIYFGQAGTVRNTSNSGALTGFGTRPIFTGGMIRRLGENTALDTDFLLINNTFFTEAGAFLLLPPNHQLQVSGLVSSGSDFGFGATYLGYTLNNRLSFSSNFRALFAGNRRSAGGTNSLTNPVQGNSKQLSTAISYQLTSKANVEFQANYSDSENGKKRFAYGPGLRYDFWRNGPNSLTLTANADNTQDGVQETVFLNLLLRFGDWGYSGQGQLARTSNSTGGTGGTTESGDVRVTWNDDKNPDRLTVIGAETHRDNVSSSYIADLDHRGNSGNLKLIASQTSGPQGDNTFYSGNFGFSIANTAHEIAWGGNRQETSGFILKNTGNAVDVPMKVFVDNSDRATFKTGTSTPLFLPPYETYKVSIKPAQSTAIDYDGSVKDITLYPGNILPLVWDINRVNVVLGHVTLPDGTPLTDARLEEARNITVTDSEGLFQGELLALKSITFKRAAEMPGFVHDDMNDFSIPPASSALRNLPSTMSVEDQRKAILALFGEQEDDAASAGKQHFPAETPLPGPRQEQKPARVLAPIHKLRPAIRCRVTLPEVKEENGVYIYPDALVCTPIPFEEDKEKQENTKLAPDTKLSPKADDGVLWTTGSLTPPDLKDNQITALFAASAKQTNPYLLVARSVNTPYYPMELMRGGLGQGGPFVTNAAAPVSPVVSSPLPVSPVVAPKHEVPSPAAAKPQASNGIEVQVGAYRTEASAREAHDHMAREYKTLAGRSYRVVKADLGDRGVYYRLHIGSFADAQDAAGFCRKLSERGQACFILPRKSNR